ncbi:MAG: sulfite exporter TauE/SafE family protein [Melioribacteraceae bacterium]|nr:sulfite exporter TauE/SafE family protein [Melioribacteraceae bacterium]MCF8265981.1 sulfite exporter TauE/SafE family protein [Melioribacteraceae bacterium]
MEILGFIAAVFIGLTLGLIGGGGSILTVPILVYLLGYGPVEATAYSLFVVGITALFGSVTFFRKKQISYLTAVVFAIPAFLAVYITRRFIVTAIPDEIITILGFILTKDIFIMVLFALLMIGSSYSMITNKTKESSDGEVKFNYPLILIEGIVVGILTGLVGAGGGFLIIPALVVFAKLPMKMAVGTSLLIIAAKSLIGFLGDLSTDLVINFWFLSAFSALAILGIFLGSYLSNYVSGKKLKPTFGWFVLVMGSAILIKEIFIK